MHFTRLGAVLLAAVSALAVAACGDGGTGEDPITLVYWRQAGQNRQLDQYLEDRKAAFERANPGREVELVPIQATEIDYHTKLELMLRSPSTAPDVVYEDSFRIGSDAAAGHLAKLDDRLTAWPDWQQYQENTRKAVLGEDGGTYGVPVGTDARALWYDKTVFAKVGLPVDWQPKTWQDVLAAARTIKEKAPDVVPLHVQTGKANGEGTTMHGFQMLFYGTGDTLYNAAERKWVVGSKGFRDSLEFVRTVFAEGLGPKLSDALSPTVENSVNIDWFPAGRIGIALHGSWLKYAWQPGGVREWPEWERNLGVAAMPTQNGQAPGAVTMSGGWTWAIPAKAGNPDGGWELLRFLQDKPNALAMNLAQSTLAVRTDVAEDPEYGAKGPVNDFFTGLVGIATYRPGLPPYPRVSSQIQEAMEAVTTGAAGVEEAAEAYDEALPGIVDGAVTTSSGTR